MSMSQQQAKALAQQFLSRTNPADELLAEIATFNTTAKIAQIPNWQFILAVGNNVGEIVEEDGTHVAAITTLENSTAHADLERNLNLMAAAPMLLRAFVTAERRIQWLLDANPDWSESMLGTVQREIQAAIARATGGLS